VKSQANGWSSISQEHAVGLSWMGLQEGAGTESKGHGKAQKRVDDLKKKVRSSERSLTFEAIGRKKAWRALMAEHPPWKMASITTRRPFRQLPWPPAASSLGCRSNRLSGSSMSYP
jgi:hypothetical protein